MTGSKPRSAVGENLSFTEEADLHAGNPERAHDTSRQLVLLKEQNALLKATLEQTLLVNAAQTKLALAHKTAD